jgi:hypothetical protein
MLQLRALRPYAALNCVFHWTPVEYSTPFHWNGAAYSTEWNVRSSGIEQGGMVAPMLPGGWNGAISKLSGATLRSGMEERKLCGAVSIRANTARIDIPYWRGIEITALTSR